MKLLITGFAPFGGQTVNPSWEAVQALPDAIGPWQLTKRCLPVIFGQAAAMALAEAERIRADAVLSIGQAGGRSAVTPEMVGINLRHAAMPDQAGSCPQDAPVVPDGPAAYFSTLPVRRMAQAVQAADVPALVSYSAGAYVCNDLLYLLLHRFSGTGVRAGFIHVPYLPEQGSPSLPLDDLIRALTAAIRAMAE